MWLNYYMQYSAGLSPIQSSVKDNASTKIGQKEFPLPAFRKKKHARLACLDYLEHMNCIYIVFPQPSLLIT